jgi:hypothetical protein
MAIVILNSVFVHKGFLKRQSGVIGLINSYNLVVYIYLGSIQMDIDLLATTLFQFVIKLCEIN